MQSFMKIILIVIAVLVGAGILGVIKEGRGGAGYGPIGVIIAMALFAGVKAIWNYGTNKPEEKNTTDIDKLDKS